jgi:D-alanine-D-alanine ligase
MKTTLDSPSLDQTPGVVALAALRGPVADRTGFPPAKAKTRIEIVTVPKSGYERAQQNGIGIDIDDDLIQRILSVHYETVKITTILSKRDLRRLVLRKPDLVFSGVKYFDFEDGRLWLNDYLDRFDIPYMASSKAALDNESDKARAKDLMNDADIPTALYFTTGPGEHPTHACVPIAFPLFVKPVAGGDSRGVDEKSIVNDFAAFEAKVQDIHDVHKSRSLVETYLSGKEYSVGIFEDACSGKLTAMPVEIIVAENGNGDRILDFQTKCDDAETVVAVSDAKVHAELCRIAEKAFRALGGKSLGRIDVKMNHEQLPHFMEANLMPGLREGYFYRACSLNLGLSYEQMILKIATNGLAGSTALRSLETPAALGQSAAT